MKNINLEEILKKEVDIPITSCIAKEWVLKAMKEAIKQALELAAENAEWCVSQNDDGEEPFYHEDNIYINKESILNTINQLE